MKPAEIDGLDGPTLDAIAARLPARLARHLTAEALARMSKHGLEGLGASARVLLGDRHAAALKRVSGIAR